MDPEVRRAQRKAGRKWPMIVIGLLLFNVGVCFTTVFAAVSNPPAVESDYYQRAVDWDAARAASPDISKRGWNVETSFVGPQAARIRIALTGDDETVIDGAVLRGVAFHQAFATDRRDLAFTETAPGVYESPWPTNLPGFWEVRLVIDADAVSASMTRTIELIGSR